MKRIVLVVLIVAALGLGSFIIFKRGATPSADNTNTTGKLPDVGAAGFPKQDTSAPSESLPADQKDTGDKMVFGVLRDVAPLAYRNINNRLLFVTQNGNIATLQSNKEESIASLNNERVVAASFSADGAFTAILYGDTSAPKISILDNTTRIWMPMDINAFSAEWAPQSSTLAIFGQKAGKIGLWLADYSKKKPIITPVTELNALDVEIGWVDAKTILLWSRGANGAGGNIWVYSAKDGLRLVRDSIPGLDAKAYGNGYYGIFSIDQSGRRGGQFSLYKTSGAKVGDVFLLTLPEKCSAWEPSSSVTASDTAAIICAAPRDQKSLLNRFLPDDYQRGEFQGSDDFFIVSLPSFASVMTYVNEYSPVDVWNMASGNKTLLMSDRYSQKLYGLILPM